MVYIPFPQASTSSWGISPASAVRFPRQDALYVLVALWTRMSAKWGLPVRIMAQKNSLKALFLGRKIRGFKVKVFSEIQSISLSPCAS